MNKRQRKKLNREYTFRKTLVRLMGSHNRWQLRGNAILNGGSIRDWEDLVYTPNSIDPFNIARRLTATGRKRLTASRKDK